MTLAEKLARGEIVLLDGATGTELEHRGVPMHNEAWSAAAIVTHPDTVRAVHEDYIRAGAEVIITNTFSTGRMLLERAGMADRTRELNLKAVELAKEARDAVAADQPVYIAGSISIWDYSSSDEVARDTFREQAEALAEGGVDLIALEMMEDTDRAALAVESAVATGLPTWVGFSCQKGEDGTQRLLHGGAPLEAGVKMAEQLGGSVITIMHSLIEDTGPALEVVKANWKGPVGAYAHMGTFTMPNWHWVNLLSPDEYAAEALKWVGLGTQIIGGCCGLGPEYIAVLKSKLPARL